MTTLKAIHKTETGEPTRIRYNGETIDAGFNVEPVDSGYVAVLDSLSTSDFEECDVDAFVDLEELTHAVGCVARIDYIVGVDALEARL